LKDVVRAGAHPPAVMPEAFAKAVKRDEAVAWCSRARSISVLSAGRLGAALLGHHVRVPTG